MAPTRLTLVLFLIGTLLAPHVRADVTPDEKAVLARLNVERALATLRHLSQEVVTTPSGAGKGTAVAGSDEERALANEIERELTRAGLTVRQERFPVRHYEYGPVTFTANGETIEAISLHSAGGTFGIRDGVPYRRGNANAGRQVRALLADAGDGTAEDYAKAGDVRGKAVLVRRGGAWPTFQILEAANRGAAALLIFDYPGAQEDTLKQDSMWYHDQLPTVSIRKRDGERLRVLAAARQPTTVTLENQIDVSDGLSQNVVATIRGRELPDEWIAVTAHYDRWFTGAQDNSVGVASMIELARTFAGTSPRRSLMFIAMGGEESGIESTESDWLAGSHAFVSAHPEVTRALAFSFNIDGAGWPSPRGYLHATIDNLGFQQQIATDLGLADRLDLRPNISSNVDGWNLGIVGGGAVAYVNWREARPDAPDLFAPLYHTQADVYDPAHFTNLIHDLSLGALGIARSDRAVLLPIGLNDMAAWATQALTTDAGRATGVPFDEALAAADRFSRAASDVTTRAATIVPAQATMWNRWLMGTRKDLMPWLLARNGSGMKTGSYASDYQTLRNARVAAQAGSREQAIAALGQVGGVRQSQRYSMDTIEAERLYWFTSGDWSVAYDQKPKPVSLEAIRVYRRLNSGGDVAAEVTALQQLEAEARGRLTDTLFLVTGKLNAAAAALRNVPAAPGSGTGDAR